MMQCNRVHSCDPLESKLVLDSVDIKLLNHEIIAQAAGCGTAVACISYCCGVTLLLWWNISHGLITLSVAAMHCNCVAMPPGTTKGV